MNNNWISEFFEKGYYKFPGVIPEELLQSAQIKIYADLDTNYDSTREIEYTHRSYCPDIRDTPEISQLLTDSPARQHIDNILGWNNVSFAHGQIAIREAHNFELKSPPEPHIDGIPTTHNGLTGSEFNNFTLLAGVFLSDVVGEFAGNFTVWEGSHHVLQEYFKDTGDAARSQGMPQIDLGCPTQIECTKGDLVLCHYQLAHAAAANLSDNNRVAVYFRIWLNDIDEFRWERMINIWHGWKSPPKNLTGSDEE